MAARLNGSAQSDLHCSLHCSLHDAGLILTTSNADFVEVAGDYLSTLATPKNDTSPIQVELLWNETLAPDPELERLGRRIWLNNRRLRFSEIRLVPGLQIDVIWEGEHLRIQAAYRWPNRRTRWLSKLVPSIRKRTYLILVYYLVYFPWGWWFERNRGWSLLHAAGLTNKQGGLVVAGLPGCGKSTFVWGALTRPDWHVLSDNLLFTDGESIWACPEPLHVDTRSQGMGAVPAQSVIATGRAFSHHRHDFEIAASRRVQRAKISQVLFLRRGQRHRIQHVSGSLAFRRLWVNDTQAQEWRAYQICTTALQHLRAEVGDPVLRWTNLDRLSRHPCHDVVAAEDEPLPSSFYQMLETKDMLLD